jgi:hypothetical protein
MSEIIVGRLLRSHISGFVVGCRIAQLEGIQFGALVKARLDSQVQTAGIVSDIRIYDDALVRQVAKNPQATEGVLTDNRLNRSVPVEISVLSVGYWRDGEIHHRLATRPPLSLEVIHLCSEAETVAFTSTGDCSYLNHLLNGGEFPAVELIAAHIRWVQDIQDKVGATLWWQDAHNMLTARLRENVPLCVAVMKAIASVVS